MSTFKCLKTPLISITLFLMAFCTSAEAQSPGTLLELIPADALFCVRINNFEYTTGRLDRFLTGIAPLPMGVSMMARMQLASITGNPQITGVDMAKHFAAFGIVLPQQPNQPAGNTDVFIAFLIPVSDYNQFTQASPNISNPDDKGISKITGASTPPAPGQTPLSGVKQIGLVAKLGDYALVNMGSNYDAMVKVTTMLKDAKTSRLSAVLDPEQKTPASQKPVWAYANVQGISKLYGSKLLGELEQARDNIGSLKPQQGGPNPAAIISAYFDILKNLLNETKSVNVTLEPKPDVLKAMVSVSALPGTETASMFSSADKAGENKLFGYFEDGAIMNFAVNTNAALIKKLTTKSVDFMSTMAPGSFSAEDNTKMKKLAEKVLSSLGGHYVCSVSANPTAQPAFAARGIAEVRDEKMFNEVIDEYAQFYNTGPGAELNRQMGFESRFTIKRGVESYSGVSIDSAQLDVTSTAPNSPGGQMINAMYGAGFNYKWAVTGGSVLCTIGPGTDTALRQMIDASRSGGPKETAAEIKAALALLPDAEKSDFFATYNMVRVFKMTMSLVPAAMPTPPIDIPAKSNFVFAGKAGGGKLVVDIALPKEHLTEFMTLSQMMLMQQMQQQQPNRPTTIIPMPPQQ